MIIIEFLFGIIKFIGFWVLRFLFWIITARDCKHCKYSYFGSCRLTTYIPQKEACRKSITRKYFEKGNKF
jgi:hypothetical protein